MQAAKLTSIEVRRPAACPRSLRFIPIRAPTAAAHNRRMEISDQLNAIGMIAPQRRLRLHYTGPDAIIIRVEILCPLLTANGVGLGAATRQHT